MSEVNPEHWINPTSDKGRRLIFERDGGCCFVCETTTLFQMIEFLNASYTKYRSITKVTWQGVDGFHTI